MNEQRGTNHHGLTTTKQFNPLSFLLLLPFFLFEKVMKPMNTDNAAAAFIRIENKLASSF